LREKMKKFRNALLLALAGLLPVCLLFSQSGTPNGPAEFDHLQDLQKSAAFYENVIGLQKMAEPFKDGWYIWFRMGAHHQLHVVGGATGRYGQLQRRGEDPHGAA
jgi:lactoylglutathione lyase